MKLLYVANARIPTEKAHGLQIMQNCEAFAQAGAGVTLWAARRINTAELRGVSDPWAHYGVQRNFDLRRLACLDLQWLVGERIAVLRRAAFLLQVFTWLLSLVLLLLPGRRADLYYTRDLPAAAVLLLLRGGARLAYEPHRLAASGPGSRLQAWVSRRAASVFPVTGHMAREIVRLGAPEERVCVAHDGIRAGRFDQMLSRAAARRRTGWSEALFVVGYVGRLHTMAMDKGVGILLQALAPLEGSAIALVGGPDEQSRELRALWCELGREADSFLDVGQVPPAEVPLYLAALDVCAMPFPWTRHFAFNASPVKLFEYMASGRPLVASDLPAVAEVLRDGEHALLVPPGEVAALGAALRRLREDEELRRRLAGNARAEVMAKYTWDTRARRILEHAGRQTDSSRQFM